MIGLANGAVTVSMSAIPTSGKMAIGMSAVAATGSASVAHQMPIQIPSAAVRQPAASSPSGTGSATSRAASAGPAARPTRW